MHSIYWLLDPETLEIRYVGQTKQDLNKRLRQHVAASKRPKYRVHYWIRSLNKAPLIKAAYTHLTQEEANTLETHEVARLNQSALRLCNLTSGGNVTQMSDDTRQRMSLAHSGAKNHFYGKTHTSESRTKIAVANKHQEWTNDRRSRHGIACSGERNGFFGKQHSETTKAIIASRNSAIYHFKAPDGKEIEVVNLLRFCREHNLNQGAMWSVAAGKKVHHKGWTRAAYPSSDP